MTIRLCAITLFAAIAFCASGQSQIKLNPASKKIFSQWTFVSGTGGITGKGPGWTHANQIVIQFKKNGTYTFCEKGKSKVSDKFKFIEEKSSITGKTELLIDYAKGQDQSFKIDGDTLYLQDEMVDGFGYRYLKK